MEQFAEADPRRQKSGCSYTMLSSDYQAYFADVILCDGRCFYSWRENPARRCDHAGLVYFENVPSTGNLPKQAEAPINSDHMVPRACGGPDAIENYVAACASCNMSRQKSPMTPEETRRAGDLRTALNPNPSYGSYWDEPVDELLKRKSHADALSWPDFIGFRAVRCRTHGWHLKDSPAWSQCFKTHDFPTFGIASSEAERQGWVSVFGDESADMYTLLTSSPLWRRDDQRHGVFVQLPRYISGRPELLEDILATCYSYEDVKSWSRGVVLDSQPLAILPLSSTNSVKRMRAEIKEDSDRLSRAVKEKCGVDWRRLCQLFVQRQWNSNLICEHHTALAHLIRKRGAKSELYGALQGLHTSDEVDAAFRSRLGPPELPWI